MNMSQGDILIIYLAFHSHKYLMLSMFGLTLARPPHPSHDTLQSFNLTPTQTSPAPPLYTLHP